MQGTPHGTAGAQAGGPHALAPNTKGHIFTSDLSIDEILLIEEVDFEPVELVLGSAYFNIGYASAPWSTNMELGDISRLMYHARIMAIERLLTEADRFDADGVLGMRLQISRHAHRAEFAAIGTAVRRKKNDRANWRGARTRPFTSNLSGIDFWALVRGGFRPVSLAHGVCVYHVAHRTLGQWFSNAGQNLEMLAFTQGMYDARELAMGRMQEEAVQNGASGVVNVTLEESAHGWDSHVIEMLAVGTAITTINDPDHEVHAPAKPVIFAED